MSRAAFAFLLLLAMLSAQTQHAPVEPKIQLPPAATTPVDYDKDIRPILQARCFGCHGPGQQMAGLRLDDAASINSKIVQPGKSADSVLIHRVASAKPGFTMPPAGQRLSPEQIGLLRAWIDAGAKMPATMSKAAPVQASHWAFRPIVRPEPPNVRNTAAVRNAIDQFVLARLEKQGIQPSPEAPKATLIRRLSLDLTGLPPTPKEVEEYVKDSRPDAYERLVDRLLASPHFGERWARHWLDLARYADSDGYEKDLVRPYAWRYRHWVINAFNTGMPFDQFTVEQMAGDLLPNPTVEQRVATGFHRNVLTNREAGVDRAEARFEQDVNRTNTVSTVFMGLTAGCAQCHNHKYDPISQKEYYQLFAFSREVEEIEIEAPLPGELGPYLRSRPEYDKKRAEILEEYNIPAMQAAFEAKLREAVENPGADSEWDFMVTEFKARIDNAVKILMIEPGARSRWQRERMTDHYLQYMGPASKTDEETSKKLKEAREKLAKLRDQSVQLTLAMSVIKPADAPRAYIALGGDYRSKGDEVDPGVPTIVGGQNLKLRSRLEFAKWLVSEENPLTARVTVNRFWNELFGRGLVRTTDDLGTQGDKPTHPELLDWLASEFRQTWDVKGILKQMVTSATYRQSSKVRPELSSIDPDNSLVARQTRLRLPAEAVRDSALAAGGLLNTEIGGKSVRPPQPAGIAELGYANSVKWAEDKGPERYRRGLYIHFQRTTPYPMLMNFDAPDSNVACTRRSRSNTPLQALNLLNDPVFLEAAQGLAYRLLTEVPGGTLHQRLDEGFRLAVGRPPSNTERQRLSAYLDQQIGILRREPENVSKLLPVRVDGVEPVEAAAWVGVSRVLLNLDEFITRE